MKWRQLAWSAFVPVLVWKWPMFMSRTWCSTTCEEFFYLYVLDLNQKGLSSIVFQPRWAHWFVWGMLCQGNIRGKSLPSSNWSFEAAMGTPPLRFQANDFQGQLILGRSLRALLPSPKGIFLLLSSQIMDRRRQCRDPKDSVLPIGVGEAGYSTVISLIPWRLERELVARKLFFLTSLPTDQTKSFFSWTGRQRVLSPFPLPQRKGIGGSSSSLSRMCSSSPV